MCPSRRDYLNAALRSDFLAFLNKVFLTLCPGDVFAAGWHLQAIAWELQQVAAGDIRRLVITMPPRSLKSISISVAWVAWRLGLDPTHSFVCASYSAELAGKLARDCRAVMRSAWYKRAFPKTRLARIAEHDFETTAGGGRFSSSVGGTLTGRGGHTIIIDDPMKPEDAFSEVSRRNVKEWFSRTVLSRTNNKLTGAIILVMQRLHEDDLAGHVLETGDWTHLTLPAIAYEDASVRIGRKLFHDRRVGDLLQPSREPLHTLEELKRAMGSAAFEAQYQQSPTPSAGNMIRAEWIGTYPADIQSKPGDKVVQSWDCAIKLGDANDYSVCVTAVVRKNKVYVFDVYRGRLDFPDLRRKAEELATEFDADVLLIEDAASGAQLIQQLHHDAPRGVPLPIACKPDRDKISRLAGCSAHIEAGGLLLPQDALWKATFLKEILSFPSSRHDDQVDALTHLISWVQNEPRLPAVSPWSGERVGVGRFAYD